MNKTNILLIFIALTMLFALANFNTISAQQTVEDQYWNLVEDSKRAEDFEYYLKEYPNGKYAALAQIKLSRLKTGSIGNSSIQLFLSFRSPRSNLTNTEFMQG